jgi:dethiobiotin synthetase
MKGVFVTGTDTEVGKTRISAGLLHCAAQMGWRAAGYKPVSAGVDALDGRWVNEDVHTLWAASSVALQLDEVGPCQLKQACAPHLAAQAEGRVIDREALEQGARQLAQRADVVVVEGVGGLCVPLGAQWDSSHLMCALNLPVVLVVGLRLGCINHALLTAECIVARHLHLVGWVGNTLDPDMLYLQDNVNTLTSELARRFRAPCLGVVPRLANPDAASVASHLSASALSQVWGQLQPGF